MNYFFTTPFRRLAIAACFLFFLTTAFAQTPPPADAQQPGRYLFIFETSSLMKRARTAVETNLQAIFVRSLDGQLQDGDEIGVWTVDAKLHTGQFPLSQWQPAAAADFYGRLKEFLGKQPYSSAGNLQALTAPLNQIVANSERLTVFIFCDGQSGITGTPFDFGLLRTFKESAATQKKLHQPFILALRAQLGKYTGAEVTLSPGTLNVPNFPPLPPPEIPPAVAAVENPVVTNAVAAPLIIIGTNVGTNFAAMSAFEKTNAPPEIIAPTNLVAGGAKTNLVSTTNAAPISNVPVAAKISPPKAAAPADLHPGFLLLIIGAATALVVLLVILLTIRSRRPRGSLITGSMNQPQPPSRRK